MKTTFINFFKHLIGFMVLFILVIFISFRFVTSTTNIKIFGFDFFIVANTRSMEPKLRHPDLILVKRHDIDKIQIGDIVTFQTKNNNNEPFLVSHEVIDIFIENDIIALRTKGINVDSFDRRLVTITGDNNTNIYIGKVIFHNHLLGILISYISSLYGIINIIFCSIVIITTNIIINKLFLLEIRIPTKLKKTYE